MLSLRRSPPGLHFAINAFFRYRKKSCMLPWLKDIVGFIGRYHLSLNTLTTLVASVLSASHEPLLNGWTHCYVLPIGDTLSFLNHTLCLDVFVFIGFLEDDVVYNIYLLCSYRPFQHFSSTRDFTFIAVDVLTPNR